MSIHSKVVQRAFEGREVPGTLTEILSAIAKQRLRFYRMLRSLETDWL